MQKITPCLWLRGSVDEAVRYYTDIFKDSKVLSQTRTPDGSTQVAMIELLGHQFMLLGGNPQFEFTMAVSFSVDCKDQAEVDHYWNALTADGGKESMCGWLTDKFGLAWQIVPEALPRAMSGPDKAGAGRAMEAMMGMRKIDVAAIERAYAGA